VNDFVRQSGSEKESSAASVPVVLRLDCRSRASWYGRNQWRLVQLEESQCRLGASVLLVSVSRAPKLSTIQAELLWPHGSVALLSK
jgi:hypothetical protein